MQVTQHFSRENVVEVRRKGERIEVITSTLWSLRVDTRVNFLLGECQAKDNLGLVKVKYTQDIDLAAFMENRCISTHVCLLCRNLVESYCLRCTSQPGSQPT